jgi:CRP/FNR family cyclic AMP-dependent transcriptional regulator
MTTSLHSLATIPALASLKPTALQGLAAHAVILTRQAGEAFYCQGDPSDGLYILLEGRVQLYRQADKRRQILAILRVQDCFGAICAPEDATCPCTAAAMTTAVTCCIPTRALRSLMAIHPDLAILLLELMYQQLRQLAALVHDLAFRDVSARLARTLLAHAEADGEITRDGIRLPRMYNQQELASMTGTVREVICRVLHKFERQGLLHQTRATLLILDPQNLAAIAAREAH